MGGCMLYMFLLLEARDFVDFKGISLKSMSSARIL